MSASGLRDSQMLMARYLRDPQGQPAPEGVEERRLKIYRDLVYNNVEGFISGGFPVLRSLYQDEDWHQLVREFIDQHRCHTPYFLEISQEFLKFLMQRDEPGPNDPPFLLELAHYEWVELALDVAEEQLAEATAEYTLLTSVPQLSPLAWLLSYQYPVHLIGPGFQPSAAEQPTYLVVYRDRCDKVCFVQLNAATARMLELVRDNEVASVQELLATLAAELGMEEAAVLDFGAAQMVEFIKQSVVQVTEAGDNKVAPLPASE